MLPIAIGLYSGPTPFQVAPFQNDIGTKNYITDGNPVHNYHRDKGQGQRRNGLTGHDR